MPAERALPNAVATGHRTRSGTLRRIAALLFGGLVIGLLVYGARSIEWTGVFAAVRRLPPAALWGAGALAAASFAVYSLYDLIGRHETGHRLPRWRAALVGVVSYAFNLNLGSLVGAIGFRYRLYAKAGLTTEVITKVLVLSMLTNWLGYLALAGSILVLGHVWLPPNWPIDNAELRWFGGALLLLALGYLGACAFAKRRSWTLRSHTLNLPPGRTAALQLMISAVNWLLIAGVLHTLLQQRVDYPTVLAVFLVAAVAGVITHVPAGVGVLEAVFVAMLGGRLPQAELLAALLAYRAVYYLGPLALASAFLVVLERLPAAVAAPQESALP